MRRRFVWITALCVFGAVAIAAGAQTPIKLTQQEADSFDKKLAALIAQGAKPKGVLRTVFTENEVNSYLKFQGADNLPVGVVNPKLSILDVTRVSATVTVNLDAVRLSKPRGWTDPLAWVTGAVEIRMVGKLRAANGSGSLELETVTLGGVPIAKGFLQEVVSFYSKTPESPAGFNLDQPFALPQRIRHVELQRGAAVIVQ